MCAAAERGVLRLGAGGDSIVHRSVSVEGGTRWSERRQESGRLYINLQSMFVLS